MCIWEGLYIPMLKLADRGVMNETLLAMIRANTRQPVETEGDVYSLAACNDIGCQRLVEMMDEFSLQSVDGLADYICETSENAVRAAIAALPDGVYRNSMRIDGFDAPVDLVAEMTIDGGRILVDFDGTSAAQRHGVNVPGIYTTAYSAFGMATAIAPEVPNNAGSLLAYEVNAPLGFDPERALSGRGQRTAHHRADAA